MDIIVENVTKKFGPQKAVDDISFSVKTGEILGFLGPNGAGKTTMMKIITNYFSPNGGRVTVGGIPVADNPNEVKKHIGYLPENNPLYLEMPVLDYLEFCAGLLGVPKNQTGDRVRTMVRICGLNEEKHKKIGELSKGFRQRVGLAQAMIHNPEVLVMDEPTSGLDPNQIIEIRKLIRELGKEKTVILSTHILPEVEATCDRILIINKGKIVADGTSDTLRKQATGQEILHVKIEDGEPNAVFTALQNLPSVGLVDFTDRQLNRFEIQTRPGMSAKRDIFKMCMDKGWALTEMIPFETKLEDVFRNLTMN
ncbi:MAG: ATP-binding cassette domain-containing protein [Bacteroidetes bacterium]|nr:ATP-binding cassette domain-containing protein [Bacteroidota bacterium]